MVCNLCLVVTHAVSQTAGLPSVRRGAVGPTNIIVQSKFGGQIFGFDIDQNGTEGVLTEAKFLDNETAGGRRSFRPGDRKNTKRS